MNMKRTYPQPDSPRENIGPRERALAVYKYLLDMEPEEARKHELYEVIKHAFEQAGTMAIRKWSEELPTRHGYPPLPVMEESRVPLIEGEFKPL